MLFFPHPLYRRPTPRPPLSRPSARRRCPSISHPAGSLLLSRSQPEQAESGKTTLDHWTILLLHTTTYSTYCVSVQVCDLSRTAFSSPGLCAYMYIQYIYIYIYIYIGSSFPPFPRNASCLQYIDFVPPYPLLWRGVHLSTA
jgi:hypothetical protein